MEDTDAWQSFVDTGNILTYLDYRSRTPAAGAARQEETSDGSYCGNGAGAPGNKI